MTTQSVKERLEYLRGELRAERISYEELAELQSLAEYINPDDIELREAAGVPENGEYNMTQKRKQDYKRESQAGCTCVRIHDGYCAFAGEIVGDEDVCDSCDAPVSGITASVRGESIFCEACAEEYDARD